MRALSRIFIWLMAMVSLPISAAAESLPRSVLILNQENATTPYHSAFFAAFRSTLNANAATPVSIYSETLEFNEFVGREYEELFINYVRQKYRKNPVGLVVASGAGALQFLVNRRMQLWSGVPVVFAAVDEPSVARMDLPPDITGGAIRYSFRNVVIAAKGFVPELKHLALVGDPFERQSWRQFRPELQLFADEIEYIDLMGLPMADLRKRVAALPDDAAIAYFGISVDGAGVRYIPRDALVALAEVANRPIVIDTEVQIGYGGTGGFVWKTDLIAEEAARLAVRILDGEAVSSISVHPADVVRPIFDWRQLQRWGISEARLPPGSEIRFREPTAWERYRWQIVLVAVALLVQSILIIGLFYEHRYRRRAEAISRSAMGKLAHMNRIATASELTASIAHEVNQPLGAMVANANAALRWLTNKTPDLDRARATLQRVVNDGHRAGGVISSVRAMFKKDGQESAPVDLNEVIQDVLGHLSGELQTQEILVQTGLTKPLPLVLGHDGQLQQVILNLVRNAADAMESVSGGTRVLRVKSAILGSERVLVSVEDSGAGIDPKDIERIFEPFFTTKTQGMGMGLSICRSIIEAHGGRLWASSGIDCGSVFNVQLPGFRPGVR
jgi:signal transduction histidine kinase